MLRTVFFAFALLAVLVFVAIATAVRIAGNYVRDNAYTIGETESARYAFDADQIDGIRVRIQLGAGTLTIRHMDARAAGNRAAVVEITDNVVESISAVEYAVVQDDGEQWGNLLVTQDADLKIPDPRQLEAMVNRWDIQLSPEIPVEITVEAGAGDLALQAESLSISRLSIELGTGSGVVDLRGLESETLDGAIDSGIGSMEIYLPRETGVRLQAESAIGSIDADSLSYLEDDNVYVNSAYVQGMPGIALRVETAVGSIEIYEE